jgi:hypothetical protein
LEVQNSLDVEVQGLVNMEIESNAMDIDVCLLVENNMNNSKRREQVVSENSSTLRADI